MRRSLYFLPYREKRRLHRRSVRAQQRSHSEVCGLLAERRGRLSLWFMSNESNRPYSYRLGRKAILRTGLEARSAGERVIGSFHSHPVGEATPGLGDLNKGFYRGVELIYDVCAGKARLWRLRRHKQTKTVREVPLILEYVSRARTRTQGRRDR